QARRGSGNPTPASPRPPPPAFGSARPSERPPLGRRHQQGDHEPADPEDDEQRAHDLGEQRSRRHRGDDIGGTASGRDGGPAEVAENMPMRPLITLGYVMHIALRYGWVALVIAGIVYWAG